MSDITPEQGRAIVTAAAEWKGTAYSLVGAASVRGKGGDCSGSSWLIYKAAGLPYDYQASGTFVDYVNRTHRFREVTAREARQEGDLLYWPGHMAIYSTFANDPANLTTPRVNKAGSKWTQTNDMWSATHTGGPAYGPGASRYFRDTAPRVFRYVH